eukprot:2316161-Lingulodinium_polyedra.AAC.1
MPDHFSHNAIVPRFLAPMEGANTGEEIGQNDGWRLMSVQFPSFHQAVLRCHPGRLLPRPIGGIK